MAINPHKSSRCNKSQFNFAVSDDIKCLLQTNLNLISNKAVNKKWNLFFKIRTKIIDLAWKIVPTCYNLKSFETMTNDSTIIKRSRRSGFIISLQKFWTVFHFFLVYMYSTSRFIDTFSEVTDSGSDTASQQSNFFEISILLEVSGRWYFCKDLSSLGSVLSITNLSGIPFYGLWMDLQFQRLCITF